LAASVSWPRSIPRRLCAPGDRRDVAADQDRPRRNLSPILYTMPFSGVEDAIAMHNAVPQGLASSIFTTDLREAELFMSGVGSDCGIVNVNVGPSGAEIGGPSAGRRKPVAVGNRAPIHGRRICAAVPTRSITRAICHWRKGSGSTPHRSEQGPAVNLLLEAGLEILSSLQLPRVIEGGDDHIVLATAHVRIRARRWQAPHRVEPENCQETGGPE